jgi:hypothetical protein
MATSYSPSPEELLQEARRRPAARTYVFEDYLESVHELRAKGSSYAEIASFLAERLGTPVTKGQVYRGYRLWLAQRPGSSAGLPARQFRAPAPMRAGRIHPNAKAEPASQARPVQPTGARRPAQPGLDELPVEML